ncbi:ATP-binding domain-containing protein [Cyanobacteria bacterium FACHB-DQ100]|nr:ATP-binding domain-containing protein [Cyanobacteria bacterium FACHB-DQ100]
MPVNDGDQGRKFITTEPLNKNGEKAEQQVWDAVRSAFSSRDCIAYWRYPIFSNTGETRKEPDILIADFELGLTVIEVKSITIDQISAINGHQWQFQNFYQSQGNPYQQAENQLFSILGYCDREPGIRRQVYGRALVALPLITEKEWQQKGLDRLPSCPPILFKNDLGDVSILRRIQHTPPLMTGKALDTEQWELLLGVLAGTPVYRKPTYTTITLEKTRSSVVSTLREKLYDLDLQQEHIGKEIPPGPQRIRGIAGSGKTVLLCQKAAHMHLKHPDWNIALVFFTRSLYSQIIEQVDKWLRHFSGGDVQYDSNTSKLRVLHAWGAKDQAGLYGEICKAHNVKRLTPLNSDRKKPNEALADVCRTLLETVEIKPIFDAILIDEGQDLVVDDDLKIEGKQPFYWMAYQTLHPVDPAQPEQRRLIWAYDEAQSLDNLKIPQAKELLGEKLTNLVTGAHAGGIKKSEIMHRCYRTPGSILTSAHAIGMGLLRPDGMLSGLTTQKDWNAIGYKVTGKFIPGQQVTIHRPPENSPNLIPYLWGGPVLEFQTYHSRQEELSALAANIHSNLKNEGLQPSRNILVVVLGSTFEAMELENHVAGFLMKQGLNIFIPSALTANVLKPRYPNIDPNKFWCEGAVTVSRIHRAKGNEADVVYVVGFDQVAKDESNITLRNQVFTALTRSRGWATLSGSGHYPMYEEMTQVISSGDTFSFVFKRVPKRDLGAEEEQLALPGI